MNKTTNTVLLFTFLLWSSTAGLFAQKDVVLTPEQIINIQNSKDYFFGEGWAETKDKAIAIAMTELKSKLKNEKVKNYHSAKLDAEEGYYYMVFIDKNAPAQPDIITTNNAEINDLSNIRQYDAFIAKFKSFNRDNKMWGSGNKADMTNADNCYVAIFKDNEMEAFLDKNTGSRQDLLTGNIIQNFETKYNNSAGYKIIWIELIENLK